MNQDIKTGTIIIFQNLDPERPVFVNGIQIATGSGWHHTGTIIKKNGKLMVFEEGTVHGAVWTDLDVYLKLQAEGRLLLAFKNLKGVDTSEHEVRYNIKADSMVGRHFYNVGLIPKLGIRGLIQQASDWCNYIGIKNEWDFKFRANPEKYGFVCSVNTCYLAFSLFGSFKKWWLMAPDDVYLDIEYTYFVQQ
jgi:hypothetical protein